MKYKKNIIDFLVISGSIGLTYLMAKYGLVYKLEHIITSEYLLALVAGIFFISFFTVVPASYLLISLISGNNPIIISLIAGVGAVIGDLLIFLFVKDRFNYGLFGFLNLNKFLWLHKLKENRFIRLILPVVGAAIIASPFPDELGVSLMGASRLKKRYFIPISYVLNAVGIYILLAVSKTI